MTGSLLPEVIWRVLDSSGKPVSGAQLFVYLTGTTTKTPSYASSSMLVQNTNPVVADSGGLFPPIFLDPTLTYRLRLTDANGAVLAPDADPFSAAPQIAAGAVSGAMLAGGAVAANLGFTPANVGGDTFDGEMIIGYALSVSPSITSVGFRGVPGIFVNAARHFAADDSGHMLVHTDGNAYAWTIDPDATFFFPGGTAISFRNTGSGVITATRGAGVSLLIAGSGTSKDVAIAQWGAGAIIKDGPNSWFITGTGLS